MDQNVWLSVLGYIKSVQCRMAARFDPQTTTDCSENHSYQVDELLLVKKKVGEAGLHCERFCTTAGVPQGSVISSFHASPNYLC